MMAWVDRLMWWLYGTLAWWCQAIGLVGLMAVIPAIIRTYTSDD